jgi:hypothetical protein
VEREAALVRARSRRGEPERARRRVPGLGLLSCENDIDRVSGGPAPPQALFSAAEDHWRVNRGA